ncbi:MAG: hypothetical protein HOV87_27710 [Catenulispora sp.]|nr:hypothetical protein [Catenulispora sp.]
MKLTSGICVTALILGGTAACASSASSPAAGGGGSSSPSTTSVGSTTPETSASSPSSGGQVQRLAEIHAEGGFAGNQPRLQPPAVVVYSDGTVVLNALKQHTLTPANLTKLMTTLRKDLDGLPEDVKPTSRPIPDIATTVLVVRKADGSEQTVRASGLPQIGKEGGYPAPLYDAYTKLDALSADPGTPFTSSKVRYLLQCPVTTQDKPKPWPAAVPQPTRAGDGNCTEMPVVEGAAADAVRAACQPAMPGDGQAKPTVPYQSDKGVRTCQWRYALPDETS